MRKLLLMAICAVGLLASESVAQQPGYFPQTSLPVVDVGNGYRLVAQSPYYRPASAAPGYFSVGYSPAYFQGFATPGYAPGTPLNQPQVYYISGYRGYLRPIR